MPRPNHGEWRGAQDSRIRTDPATIANLAGRRPPSQIASKRQGRPKSFGLWYPAKNLGGGAGRGGPRARNRYFYFLFPRLSAGCCFQKRLAQSAMANVRTLSAKPDERFAKSAKHLLEINAEFPQARPSRSSLS